MSEQPAKGYTSPQPIEGQRIEDEKDSVEALGLPLWSEQPAETRTPLQPTEDQRSGDQMDGAEALRPTSR